MLFRSKVDVRVIAASNRSLEEAVRNGTFRDDLYYRIKVIGLVIPPLRERKDDIPLLCQHFLERFAKQSNRPVPRIGKDAMGILTSHRWPGNVRELENVMERAMALEESSEITPESLPFDASSRRGTEGEAFLPEESVSIEGEELCRLELVEKKYIEYALAKFSGNYTQTARALGISLSTLRRKVKSYGLVRADSRIPTDS